MKTTLFTLILLFASLSFAEKASYFQDDGIFMEGYDVVSYIKDQKATKGQAAHKITHDGTTFYFSSQENKDLFSKSPDKYIPAYKGWCAYAMADSGSLVSVDPKTFKVINGKTYFFYNTFWADTLKKWNKKIKDDPKKETELVNSADSFWQKKHN